MNPQIIAALISLLGPQLLGKLFGGGGAEERLRRQLEILFSPGALAERTNKIQAEWYRSPAYGAAQAGSIAAGRLAESEVGRAGAGVTSGIDVLRGGVAAGLGPAFLAKSNADAYTQSQTLAQQQAQGLAASLVGTPSPPNISREMLGASLNFIGPLLTSWLRRKWGWGDVSTGRTEAPDRWS